MDRRSYLKAYRADYKGRHKRVNLTLALPDYDRLARIAARDGEAITTAAYNHLMAALDGKPHLPGMVATELSSLKYLLSTIANNINQMAHYSHIVRQFTNEDQLLSEIERLQSAIETFTHQRLKDGHDH